MSKAVRSATRAIQRLYPRELANSSWDNTGLLLDSSEPGDTADPSVLLTIDLTASVCDEAIAARKNFIIAYHPFIFRGLKSITPADPQQRSLLRLVKHGISVYCPHTAVDAAKNGVNDWLADVVSGGTKFEQSRSVIEPVTGVEGHDGAGMGRLVVLETPVAFAELISRVKKHLGLATVPVVLAPDYELRPVTSVAMCAGSGGSILGDADADVYFTGELGHHEMLKLRETGKSAIIAGHSNTERGFLPILAKQLAKELTGADITIAKTDKDPLEYL